MTDELLDLRQACLLAAKSGNFVTWSPDKLLALVARVDRVERAEADADRLADDLHIVAVRTGASFASLDLHDGCVAQR